MSIRLPENLGLIAAAPGGIRKLRGLILELAVRGKLVPQDPSDEPASELLKRIATERARLVADGKIKKDKPLPPVGEDEKPFELPTSWEWVRLGDVTNFGQTDKSCEISDNTWVLDLEDIEKDTSVLHRKIRFSERQAKSDKNRFLAGDVLYGKLRPYLNKVIVADEEGVCTTEILPVRGFTSIAPRFLMHALKRPDFLTYVNSKSYGMKMPRLGTEDGRSAAFPLPPLAEQHRIVAKVDELMALCDRMEAEQADAEAAHATLVQTLLGTPTQSRDAAELAANWQRLSQHFDTLFTTEASLDALKQTVLQLAVMGKLVHQDPNDEPASELLKRIAAEKARLVVEGKIRKDKPLPPVSKDEKPFELPDGWGWVRAADVTSQITDGTHHTPTYVGFGIPFISVKDVSSGTINFSNTRYISEKEHLELTRRCNPEKGDLLLTKVGTTGIAVLIDTSSQFSIFVSVALLKLPVKLIGRYLELLINSPFVRQQSADGTEGVGNKNLVLRKISSFVLPIPPLAEQHRIVAKVDELMALCDGLKAALAESRARQARLATTLIESALQAA